MILKRVLNFCICFLCFGFSPILSAYEMNCAGILQGIVLQEASDGITIRVSASRDDLLRIVKELLKVGLFDSRNVDIFLSDHLEHGAIKTEDDIIQVLSPGVNPAEILIVLKESTSYEPISNIIHNDLMQGSHVSFEILPGSNLISPATTRDLWERHLTRSTVKRWKDRMTRDPPSSKTSFKPFYIVFESSDKLESAEAIRKTYADFWNRVNDTPSYQSAWPDTATYSKNREDYNAGWANPAGSRTQKLFAPFPQDGQWAQAIFVSSAAERDAVAIYLGSMPEKDILRYKIFEASTPVEKITQAFRDEKIPTFESRKEVFQHFGFQRLGHYTTFRNLVEILKSGRLSAPKDIQVPFDLNYGYTHDVLCLSLLEFDMPDATALAYYSNRGASFSPTRQTGDLEKVHIVFDLSVFDQEDLRISGSSLGYGVKSNSDYLSSQGTMGLFNFLTHYNRPSEVLSLGLDTDKIFNIWVHPLKREKLIKLCKEAGISSVRNRPIEEVVVSPPTSDAKITPIPGTSFFSYDKP